MHFIGCLADKTIIFMNADPQHQINLFAQHKVKTPVVGKE